MVKDSPYFSLLSAKLSWLVDHLATTGTTKQTLFGLERPSEVTLTIGSLLLLECMVAMSGGLMFLGDKLGYEIQRSAVNLLCTLGSQAPVSLSMR